MVGRVRLRALKVAHHTGQTGNAAVEPFPSIFLGRDEQAPALAFDVGGLTGDAELFGQADGLTVPAGEDPDTIDGRRFHIYVTIYIGPIRSSDSRPLLGDSDTSPRGQGSAPIPEVSGLSRSLGSLKKGRVKNHANSLGENKMAKNMVIKTDGLSAAACERTRGL